MKTVSWQLDLLAIEYHWETLKNRLSSDPVRFIMNPKLGDTIRGPVSPPAVALSILERINKIIHLLREAVFAADAFDVKYGWSVDKVE